MILSIGSIRADEQDYLFSLHISPDLSLPLGNDTELFNLGGGGQLSAEFPMPFFPDWFISAGIEYNYVPLLIDTDLSLLSFGGGTGLSFSLSNLMHLRIFGSGGYFYGLLHDGSSRGGNPFVSVGTGMYFRITQPFSVGVDCIYHYYMGLTNDLNIRMGAL